MARVPDFRTPAQLSAARMEGDRLLADKRRLEEIARTKQAIERAKDEIATEVRDELDDEIDALKDAFSNLKEVWPKGIRAGGGGRRTIARVLERDFGITGPIPIYSSYADAEDTNVPAAATYFYTLGYYEPGDGGGALYVRASSEPSHEGKLPTNGGSVWWELREAIVTPQMFGAKGDNVTDDHAAIIAAIEYNPDPDDTSDGAHVRFLNCTYYVGQTINIKRIVLLEGSSSGHSTNSTTGLRSVLRFAADTTGLIVNRGNTIDNTTTAIPGTGDTSIIRGLRFLGSGTDPAAHGVRLRARATIQDCYIYGFPGDGVHIVADATTGDTSLVGNANCFVLERILARNNGRHGVYVDNADANAGYGIGVNVSSNGRYGIYDSSFLGNTWIACHAATNGVSGIANNAAGQTSRVRYANNIYQANPSSTEALYVATTPGTSESVWVFQEASVGADTWLPGQPEGTYFAGGAYRSDNANARNVFIGCYSEGSQGASDFAGPTLALGGMIGNAGYTRGGHVGGIDGNQLVVGNGEYKVSGDLMEEIALGGDDANGDVLRWKHVDDSSEWRFRQKSADYRLDYGNSDLNVVFRITSPDTANTFGTEAPIILQFYPHVLAFGNGSEARRHHMVTALPLTSGSYGRGDVVWLNAPSTSRSAAWSCLTAGTVGTLNGGATTGSITSGTNTLTVSSATGLERGVAITIAGVSGVKWVTAVSGTTITLSSNADATVAGAAVAFSPPVFRSLGGVSNSQTVNTNADFTLTAETSPEQTRHTGTLTADRTVTLTANSLVVGSRFRIARTGGGAFKLNVGTGPVVALATNEWAEVRYDGSAWFLSAFGRLTPDLQATATVNPASLAPGQRTATATVAVAGAALGDLVRASFSLDIAPLHLHAWVSAVDTVSYYFENPDALLTGSATYDAPSIAAAAETTTTVTVTGAALGDVVAGLSLGVSQAGLAVTGYVSAADTVTVVLKNGTGAPIDLASTTLRAQVRPVTPTDIGSGTLKVRVMK